MNDNFFISTFGCKLNIYESESISYILKENGFIHTDKPEASDIIIINSCTVTTKADAKCRNSIRKLKKENPNAITILCGCLVNTDINELVKMEEVDIFIENKDKDKILDAINLFKKTNIKPLIYKAQNDGSFNFKTYNMANHSRAFIKIQDGCDNYCSYCKIPYARGKSRSRDLDSILFEIENIITNNFNEIVLTGINIGSFMYNNIDFAKLLDILTQKFTDTRFRISSIEPDFITDQFINVFSKKNICSHIHIPLQSGSDKILKLMNRKYNLEQFYDKIEKLKKIKDNPFLSSDLILGFPSESNANFEETIDFINKVNFSFIHLFGYSPRKGTKAYDMPEKVPERIRDERITQLKTIVENLNLNYRKQFVNKTLETIIEKKHHNYYTGKTDNYIDLKIFSQENLISKKKYNVLFKNIEGNTNIGITQI
ncbi:MAG: tRNA (N(6)-L-threonylcarbamoyladenosine(37)-C(2))-methylthiotransferase MtaB [Spirochaetes bacterium GWD1_27_9]|nr:MAG: tRNA (N(6)-L-threonylcarbamoyladenosine(37)-C(2))-methylthiotransferase MtaB [Spirochaetes bacterium GWB1_27_13]OHD39971.1 MAG: tRNA (N(6)-L-threonylcarbamoyladenosine(37)-C(2))-methylthiotransferase MtaB [Spirochaetes bacterium GWD1_27_9]